VTHTVACRKDLWTALVEKPLNGSYGGGAAPEVIGGVSKHEPKRYYAARYAAAVARRDVKLLVYAWNVSRVRRDHRGYYCGWFVDVWLIPLVLVLAIIFLICLIYQLDTAESVSYFTLWPLLAIGFIIAIATTTLCMRLHCCVADGALPADFYRQSHSLVKDLVKLIGDGASALAQTAFCRARSRVSGRQKSKRFVSARLALE
jgi:hypothetical protein